MKVVNLSGEVVSRCLRLAEQRNNKARQTSRAFANRNGLLIHQIGVIGEAALAELLRLPVDDRITLNGDAGYDFTIGKEKIEIKARDCRKNQTPDFMIRTNYVHADFYFLAWVNPSDWHRVTIVGWTDKESVKTAEIKTFGYGDRYYIPYQHLSPLWSFGIPVSL